MSTENSLWPCDMVNLFVNIIIAIIIILMLYATQLLLYTCVTLSVWGLENMCAYTSYYIHKFWKPQARVGQHWSTQTLWNVVINPQKFVKQKTWVGYCKLGNVMCSGWTFIRTYIFYSLTGRIFLGKKSYLEGKNLILYFAKIKNSYVKIFEHNISNVLFYWLQQPTCF